jgi:hypothetical protein
MHPSYICRLVLLAATLTTGLPAPAAAAAKQTVCTITVNSADEKEAFRRHLPESKYQFVELVERGRPDWLASACRAGVSCDVLIISGHYDGGNEFFSDRLESQEFLPVDEMERVSCSDSCPALFSQLKEVHLFGCNTLNPAAQSAASEEVVRSLVREGRSVTQAQLHWKTLNEVHGESSRDRMRLVFKDVPVIYGFSSVAPLGPIAATSLNSFFRNSGVREIGQGRPSSRLLGQFAPYGMTVARGMTDQEPQAGMRRDVCQFADDRVSEAKKLDFVHQLLQRQTGEARIYLDRIQRLATTLQSPERRTPEVVHEFTQIADDTGTRARFLEFARDADRHEVRARMVKLARELGWLTVDEQWQELALMLGDLLDRSKLGLTEVDLACTLNRGHELDGAFSRRVPTEHDDVAHAAVRACLGSAEGYRRTLEGLVGSSEADVQLAQAYLRHRPINDITELRQLAANIADMRPSEAQVRALEALGRHYLSDRGILEMLERPFSSTSSWSVQAAIAGILMRADQRSIASAGLLRTLRDDRLPSPAGEHMVDALIRRLQAR